ncbi:hypothetical protein JKP88DRAFT_185189 [Tribonema minus]|uniref:Class I SAM-dependent methyltransferase n=1 Tax=Tribonema minus TaxID=303371 RepID=A0A835Z2H5_9STRA|nr:hypothetical protein JKP88DRAFT_185189 [Tribonema minus]
MVDDALFKAVTGLQTASGKPWGRFLDSGTGTHSLRWVHTLPTAGWTAVTADAQFAANMQAELQLTDAERAQASTAACIIVGNWQDESFQEGEIYDTILADYLIGAIDGFSPYYQDEIFDRLKRHLAPGGTLFIIGMQPVPDSAPHPANIVTEVARLRDACILLAGHRPYREFPLDWVERHLKKAGFAVTLSRRMPILHSEGSIRRQLDVASRKLPYFEDRDLAAAMERHIAAVGARIVSTCSCVRGGRIQLGFDYVVAAEPLPRPPGAAAASSENGRAAGDVAGEEMAT